jgi:hypothetical protein
MSHNHFNLDYLRCSSRMMLDLALSRFAKIQTNCKLFFDRKLAIYCNALRTLGHCAKRLRRLTDGERDERRFKNAQALCLQGNLSKAYKTIIQKELTTGDKIPVLRDQHLSAPTFVIQEQELLQVIQ